MKIKKTSWHFKPVAFNQIFNSCFSKKPLPKNVYQYWHSFATGIMKFSIFVVIFPYFTFLSMVEVFLCAISLFSTWKSHVLLDSPNVAVILFGLAGFVLLTLVLFFSIEKWIHKNKDKKMKIQNKLCPPVEYE